MKNLISFSFLILILASCQTEKPVEEDYGNLAAEGFDFKGSDNQAIALADSVMAAMGGRKAWDETEFLVWNFFGRRKHFWNKKTGDIRIESAGDTTTYLMNINTMKGKVKRGEEIISHPDTLQKFLSNGKSMWINDAYWLVMPFKLKDSGVTLKYVGTDTTQAGKNAAVLSLTFKEVGDTPQNKYHVFVDDESNLITEWAFFLNATDSTSRFTTPWVDYKEHGQILLSGNRGRGQLTEIGAPDSLDVSLFREF